MNSSYGDGSFIPQLFTLPNSRCWSPRRFFRYKQPGDSHKIVRMGNLLRTSELEWTPRSRRGAAVLIENEVLAWLKIIRLGFTSLDVGSFLYAKESMKTNRIRCSNIYEQKTREYWRDLSVLLQKKIGKIFLSSTLIFILNWRGQVTKVSSTCLYQYFSVNFKLIIANYSKISINKLAAILFVYNSDWKLIVI